MADIQKFTRDLLTSQLEDISDYVAYIEHQIDEEEYQSAEEHSLKLLDLVLQLLKSLVKTQKEIKIGAKVGIFCKDSYLSKCCKAVVSVDQGEEGTSCWVCGNCNKPCDVILSPISEKMI